MCVTLAECIEGIKKCYDDVPPPWLDVLCNMYEQEHDYAKDIDIGATQEMLGQCRWLSQLLKRLILVWDQLQQKKDGSEISLPSDDTAEREIPF